VYWTKLNTEVGNVTHPLQVNIFNNDSKLRNYLVVALSCCCFPGNTNLRARRSILDSWRSRHFFVVNFH
jgi:hypothetical protein